MPSFTHPIDEHAPAPGLPINPPPTPPVATPKTETKWIALGAIAESPFNPRKDFPAEGLAELAESIRARGLLEPLVVRPMPQKAGQKTDRYELMAGHRRLRALKLNKAEGCTCTVIEADDGQARATLIVENLQREDLGPMEEAAAFDQLNTADPLTWTPAAIAAAIGKTPRFVQQRLALKRNLAPETAAAIKTEGLKIEAARVLAAAPQALQQKVLGRHWNIRGMTADEAREQLAQHAVPEAAAAFDVKLYTGEYIDEGKKRLFADVALFTKLQTVAAKEKVEQLKKDWPDAKIVSEGALHTWSWGDNGERVSWSAARQKATGSYSKAKCTALVWIDGQHRIRTAEGVKPEPKQSRPSYRSAPSYKETPERKVAREAFNGKLAAAHAHHATAPIRLLLLDIVTGDSGINISAAILKRALPTIAMKATYMSATEKAKVWPQFAALKDAAVLKAFQELGRGIIDGADKFSYFGWRDHEKACPALLLALGKTLDVAPEAEKPVAAPAADKAKTAAQKKAAPKAKKKGRAKSATRKKHQ